MQVVLLDDPAHVEAEGLEVARGLPARGAASVVIGPGMPARLRTSSLLLARAQLARDRRRRALLHARVGAAARARA